MKRLELQIDQLVLRGFRPEHGRAIAESLSAELGRLMATPEGIEALRSGAASRHLAVALPTDGLPADTGRRVARAIVRRVRP
ncbi:hypothetical protein [Niveibacterium terrae]|uniref:hypothetical protein n=1 Tax=Niveibacterium terrae TaxID=3373598 RepID=UPI003A9599E2